MRHQIFRLPLLSLAAGLATAAAPPPPSPEQAKVVEAQITAWLTTITGGVVPLPPRPVQLTPEGDHYLVRVPVAPLFGKDTVEPADATYTATARQIGDTRWSLDNQQFPSPLTIHAKEMVPAAPAAAAPKGAPHAPPTPPQAEDVTYRIKFGKQDSHSVLDTSFATPTNSSGTLSDLDIEKEGGSGATLSHIDQVTTQANTQPTDPAHADVLSDALAKGYSIKGATPDGAPVTLQIGTVHVVSALTGLSHDQVLPLVKIVTDFAKMAAPAKNAPLTPEQRAKLHEMLAGAHAILTGGRIDETLEGMKFDIGGNAGKLDRLRFSFDGQSPANTLTAAATLTLEGLTLDALPPQFAAYVPTRFTIHPTVSNIDVAALTKMGMDATAPVPPGGKPPPEPSPAALFGKGGIHFGFDSLGLDMAGVAISGTGDFTSTGPMSVIGQAELSATGLPAFIDKAKADPMLAQAVPVLIFLKGISKSSADRDVWQITVNNGKALVNGVDLSAMAGAMGK